jgi:hypothetical protein
VNRSTPEIKGGMEEFVWDAHKPWAPRPLLSIHVRLGDKRREMHLYSFKVYMHLARRLQRQFPDVKNVWLSTEMQVRHMIFVQGMRKYTVFGYNAT